ncbi:hypothetical protein [Aquipuribacter sp. MA13-6]|uniref:hypothetical protein n=1 Tax=unclassified Aquipuribacter TaxID=2635084 RepID=UPI003EED07B7
MSAVPTVRVVAADVNRFRGSRGGLLRLLRDTAADVALLHRVPVHLASSHRLGALGSDVGLVVGAGGRASGGAAVLVSLRVEPTSTTVFRGAGGGLAVVTARLTGGQQLRVATLDVRGDEADQAALAAHLVSLLAADGVPTVVAGPLPGTTAGDTLGRRLRDLTPDAAATTPAERPSSRPLGLLGCDVQAVGLALPGEPGRRPELLARVLPARPTLVEVTLG